MKIKDKHVKCGGLSIIILILIVFPLLYPSAPSVNARRYGARIISTWAVSSVAAEVIIVSVDFINEGVDTLWIGLSFKAPNGEIVDVPPRDVSHWGKMRGWETFTVYLELLPWDELDVIKKHYKWRGLKYCVALWEGYDGRYMYGEYDRTGWLPVAGLNE